MKKEKPIVPKVGMGCTLRSGSDCYPYEVIKVIDRKTAHVIVRGMSAVNKAHWPEQDYALTSDLKGPTVELEMFHGQLREIAIDPVTHKRHHLPYLWYSHYSLGNARYYQDPRFCLINPTHTART